MLLAQGTKLGPYEIVAPVGAGGMGEVYRARDTRLGRMLAIKIISPSAPEDAETRRRLLREARAASALNHPNIVTVHDIGTDRGVEFVVMELVEGGSLADELSGRRLPIGDVVKYAAQIASAVAAAHAAGIVHRDLKPSNVMITGDGTVKVVDFGIAKSLGPQSGETATMTATDQGRIIGTVGYMSPEQAEGRSVDARSDIFSFGSMLYEMVSGQQPFRRDTALATMAAIARDEPPALSTVVDSLPRDLEDIVTRCLRKDPSRRFQSMADVRMFLEELRERDNRPEAGDVPARSGTSRRIGAALIAGIILGVVAMAGVAMWQRDGTAPSLPTDLTRLTYDDGYTEGPALAPDGTLVAYASDRAGGNNLDIWMQRVTGGEPIRLTQGPADERQPAFSPDGGQIVFRSEADGGALYTIPSLGGTPRLLVERGIAGRYSPDGQQIAYWTGSQIGTPGRAGGGFRTYIVPAAGGSPTELSGFNGARHPVWSSDGKYLVVSGSRGAGSATETYDWWVVRVEDGAAFATGAASAFRTVGFESTGATGSLPTASAWIGDRILAAGRGNVWSVTVGPSPEHLVKQVQRLTFGPGESSEPSVSRDGMVAFIGSNVMHNIWSLPIDAETATVRGELRQVTRTAGTYTRATFSIYGQTIAFQAQRGRRVAIMTMDLATGHVVDLAVPARPFGPVISPEGTRVAYPGSDGAAYVIDRRGGAPKKLCDKCTPGDWTNDGRQIITNDDTGEIKLVNVESGATRLLLDTDRNLNRPHVSPDNRWLAFRTQGGGSAQVVIAPFRPGSPPPSTEWVVITDPERDVRPCGWAPSSRMLYLVSSRDGFRCLYACPWDPQKGRATGPVRLVGHFHNFRNVASGGTSVISTGAGNAVMKDQILFDLPSSVSNIWTMRLP